MKVFLSKAHHFSFSALFSLFIDLMFLIFSGQNLVYWRSPIKSAIVMVAGLTVLISLGCLSMISVFAYLCLGVLCCTGAWRVYYDVVKSKKAGEVASPSPFGDYASKEFVIPRDKVTQYVDYALDQTSDGIMYLKYVLLIESYLESLKVIMVRCACILLFVFYGRWSSTSSDLSLPYIRCTKSMRRMSMGILYSAKCFSFLVCPLHVHHVDHWRILQSHNNRDHWYDIDFSNYIGFVHVNF